MSSPSIHFTRAEFETRQARARQGLADLGLDGLLIFKAEDMYWLTGYESDGFCIFGAMFLGTDGALTHLARPADLGNVAYSSVCEDVRIAYDGDDMPRARQVRDMLEAHGMGANGSAFRPKPWG